MNRKEKLIGWAGWIAGNITGGILGYYWADFDIVHTIAFVIAIACLAILALLTYATICEVRAEERRKAYDNRPASWHFDKSYED